MARALLMRFLQALCCLGHAFLLVQNDNPCGFCVVFHTPEESKKSHRSYEIDLITLGANGLRSGKKSMLFLMIVVDMRLAVTLKCFKDNEGITYDIPIQGGHSSIFFDKT